MLTIRRLILLLQLGCVWLVAGVASAQHYQPFGELDREEMFPHDAQWFAPAELTGYGGQRTANNGIFATWDGLWWAISNPDQVPIGRPGGPDLVYINGVFRFDGNDVSTGAFDTEMSGGNRFEVGYMDGCYGWSVSYFQLQTQNQRLTATDASVLFNDTGAPFDGAEGFHLDPQDADVHGAEDLNATRFIGVLTGFVPDFFVEIDPNTGEILNLASIVFDADIDGDGVFGRFGLDIATLDEDGNLVDPPGFVPDGIPDGIFLGDAAHIPDLDDLVRRPVVFDELHARLRTEMSGAEVSRICRSRPFHYGGHVEWYFGARYIRLEEDFEVDALGGLLADSLWHTSVDNNIIGPQLGLRYFRYNGRWRLDGSVKFTAGINLQNFRQRGTIASEAVSDISGFNPGDDIFNLLYSSFGLRPTSWLKGAHDYEFAPVVEFNVATAYQLTRALSVRVGVNGMWMDGISRASSVVDYSLPTMGFVKNRTEPLFVYGPFVGIELNR